MPTSSPDSWIGYWDLWGDPFSPRPLDSSDEFRRLLVRSREIDSIVELFVGYFPNSKPRPVLISGSRGVGKSILIHHIKNQLEERQEVLTTIVTVEPSVVQAQLDPVTWIANDMMCDTVLNTYLNTTI